MTPVAEVLAPGTFAKEMLLTAEQSGFEMKSLNGEILRRLFRDVTSKNSICSASDADALLGGGGQAVLDLAVKAGFAREFEENGKKLFWFYKARMSTLPGMSA